MRVFQSPEEIGILLDDREHAAVALGRYGSVEKNDVQVTRLRLNASVDEVLKRLP